jgi:hypothetical protein
MRGYCQPGIGLRLALSPARGGASLNTEHTRMTRERDQRPQPVGDWTPPPLDECQEYPPYDSPVGDPGDILRIRQCWDLRDRLVDFAIIQMSPLRGRLRRVAVADICHGELHIHVLDQQEIRIRRESIWPVNTQLDVEKSYDAGLDRITEKWQDYKRRWRDG